MAVLDGYHGALGALVDAAEGDARAAGAATS